MRISDWSSDVCSSDLRPEAFAHAAPGRPGDRLVHHLRLVDGVVAADVEWLSDAHGHDATGRDDLTGLRSRQAALDWLEQRSEEHTSELQSLMRISYAVFCLKKKNYNRTNRRNQQIKHKTKNTKATSSQTTDLHELAIDK